MQILTDVLDHKNIDWLRNIVAEYSNRFQRKKDYGNDARIYFGHEYSGYIQFEKLIKSLLPVSPKSIMCAYERQYDPTPLHVDPEPMQNTLIIPLHDDPDCKTLGWIPWFETVSQWHQFVQEWQPHGQYNHGLSKKEMIDHCYDHNKECNMGDYLELDGIFSYRLGSIGVFSARQVHCSSDWKQLPNYQYKDFIVIHTYH